ncbi:MAG: dipeptide epimerase, partial [Alphaproteobacteria bacterium]|nr:dipeptide epimerase [Alphaproteobacteria bacterium]
MRITKVEAIHVRVPLEKPYIFGRGTASAFDNVVVRVSTDEGLIGYGESVPLSVLGNAGTLTDLLNGPLAALAVGGDPFDVESLMT